MAIIQCPECGRNISDKASKCIHCGKKLIEEIEVVEVRKCSECGGELSESDTCCTICGCPIKVPTENTVPTMQAVEVASVKVSNKTKKIAVISIVAIISCAILVFAIKYVGNIKAENTYIDNLVKVRDLALSGAAKAEDLCNLTYDVWKNTIYQDRDSNTDPYTRPNGYWVEDFNDTLANLYAADSTDVTISSIEENQAVIKTIMKDLQNPPDELEKCYDTLSDLYSAYNALTTLSISPSGSLKDFSDKASSASSDFMDAYEKLDNQIPERDTNK